MALSSAKIHRPYLRVAEEMRAKIRDGVWPANMMLAGRKTLAATFQVACTTIDRSVMMLVSEGLLRVDDRRGTFVAVDGDKESGAPLSLTDGLQYRPHSARRDPVHATIGIIADLHRYGNTPAKDTQWPLLILRGCEQILADELGITHRFANHINVQDQTIPIAETLEALHPDSLDALLLIRQTPADLRAIRAEIAHLPHVYINIDQISSAMCQVNYDHRTDGVIAGRHVLRRGYRALTLFGPPAMFWWKDRTQGIRTALSEAGLPPATLTIVPAYLPEHRTNGEQARPEDIVHALLAGIHAERCIIAGNDRYALIVLQAAEAMGLRAGRDFGLLGFDDHPDARESGLTSLRPPMEAMGQEAARLIIRALKGDVLPTRVELPSHLIARTTTQYAPVTQVVSDISHT